MFSFEELGDTPLVANVRLEHESRKEATKGERITLATEEIAPWALPDLARPQYHHVQSRNKGQHWCDLVLRVWQQGACP